MSKLNSYVSNIIPDLHFSRRFFICDSTCFAQVMNEFWSYYPDLPIYMVHFSTLWKLKHFVKLMSTSILELGSLKVLLWLSLSTLILFWMLWPEKYHTTIELQYSFKKEIVSDELFSILLLYAHYQVNFTRPNWSIWGYDKNFYLLPRLLNFRVKVTNFLLSGGNYIQPMFAL